MANLLEHDFNKNQVGLDISRSVFRINHNRLATANAGDLNVCYFEEVLPGDTFNLQSAVLARMATPIHPTMSKAYMNIEFFFVPSRLVWDHWEEFLGVNKDTYWAQPTSYNVPQITAPTGGWQKGSLADQFGIPINKSGFSISALPFRAYGLIYNYFFRNKNLQTPIAVNVDDTTRTGTNGTNYITDCQLGGMPAKACKLGDMYTRALPAPQKGPSVSLPLGTSAPIIGNSSIRFVLDGTTQESYLFNKTGDVNDSHPYMNVGSTALSGGKSWKYKSGLNVDLTNATAATVNQLRLAFATQRILEAQARAGCSYQELLHGLFHVDAGDARLQQPEFLGGKKFNISISQVLQTSSTDSTSPQGNTAAFSLSYDKDIGFKKSFVEHGFVIGVYTIRNENLYQQGIPKYFSKTDRYDFYWHQLANIGEVAIKNKELFVSGTAATDEGVFGYQEAWYEYRNHQNEVTGEFRSDYSSPLDSWHYADDYSSTPVLGSTFVSASKVNIDRTLAVTSHDQFLCNFYFDNKATRPLPLYSVPGLIDHH